MVAGLGSRLEDAVVTAERADGSPFIGPRPYSTSERAMFFGRDEEVSQLVSLVIAHPTVLLFAVSGAGKTSLLSAGAIPALAEQGFEVLPRLRLRTPVEPPRDARNAYMFSALWGLAHREGATRAEPEAATTLAETLAAEPRGKDRYGFPSPRLVVFDQFEEIFTAHPDRWRDRGDFFGQVSAALTEDPSLRVLFALREEYLAQLDRYGELMPDGLRTRLHLERLRREAALAAVRGPLQAAGVSIAPAVAETLVSDLEQARVDLGEGRPATIPGEFVEPVHLQVVCRMLWSRLGGRVQEVTDADLAALGTVDESLTAYYDEAIAAAAARSSAREPAVRAAFERAFVTSAGTRAAVFGGSEQSRDLPVASLEALSDRHLIRGEWRAGGRWLELAHDRLIAPLQRSNALVRNRTRRRRLRLGLAAAITVAALLGGAAALLLRSGPAPPNFQALLAAYPGEKANQEAIARWMGRAAKAQSLPPELPVMAALVESGLKNLKYGDADSVGYFQMSQSVWDRGSFAGFSDRPPIQLLWFITQATTVRTQRLTLGSADPAKSPDRYGEWIADATRPPEQYRGRFQLRYHEARQLLGLERAPSKTVEAVPTDSAVGPYPGDSAARAAVAAWMGRAARANAIPPELPVMAALAESGMTNRRPGRDDSAGYFLMRRSIWDRGRYAGFVDHPRLQLLWFLTTAAQVRQARLARGLSDPAASPSRYGTWVADVERPAESQRDRYQPQLEEARRLLAAAALPAPAAPPAGPVPAPAAADPAAAAPAAAAPAAAAPAATVPAAPAPAETP